LRLPSSKPKLKTFIYDSSSPSLYLNSSAQADITPYGSIEQAILEKSFHVNGKIQNQLKLNIKEWDNDFLNITLPAKSDVKEIRINNKILSKVVVINTPEELNDGFIFGKDYPKTIVVKEDFERYNNYTFENNILTINCYQKYTDVEDVMKTRYSGAHFGLSGNVCEVLIYNSLLNYKCSHVLYINNEYK
jgi:hypothetical protein